METSNFAYLNNKIEVMKGVKLDIIKMLPKTRLAKLAFNLKESKLNTAQDTFELVASLTGEEDVLLPVEAYDILFEAVKMIERSILNQISFKRLDTYVQSLKLNDRAQLEFDTALRKNNKDKCLIIIANEKRRLEETERAIKQLYIRIEHDKFNKHVAEVEQMISQWLDEDGRPRFKSVNVSLMNNQLAKLYTKDEILEGYKVFLDTDKYFLLLSMIEKNLNKRKGA